MTHFMNECNRVSMGIDREMPGARLPRGYFCRATPP